jgi:hypothetical protein
VNAVPADNFLSTTFPPAFAPAELRYLWRKGHDALRRANGKPQTNLEIARAIVAAKGLWRGIARAGATCAGKPLLPRAATRRGQKGGR